MIEEERKTFFKSIFEKPWEQVQSLKDNDHDGKLFSISGSRLALKTIIAVSSVIFSLFVVAYSDQEEELIQEGFRRFLVFSGLSYDEFKTYRRAWQRQLIINQAFQDAIEQCNIGNE